MRNNACTLFLNESERPTVKSNDTKRNNHPIYSLAAKCRVSMLAACRRAGMAPSTPFRWGQGQQPKPGQQENLRAAILVLALERGTLPADLAKEARAAVKIAGGTAPNADPADIVQEIKQGVKRLERALARPRK